HLLGAGAGGVQLLAELGDGGAGFFQTPRGIGEEALEPRRLGGALLNLGDSGGDGLLVLALARARLGHEAVEVACLALGGLGLDLETPVLATRAGELFGKPTGLNAHGSDAISRGLGANSNLGEI